MKKIVLKSGQTISEELSRAIQDATPSSVEYEQVRISGHPDRKEQKKGYRPLRISGVAIPPFLLVTFVVGRDERGEHFYVVNRFLNAEYAVTSEAEARALVLIEIRRIIDLERIVE